MSSGRGYFCAKCDAFAPRPVCGYCGQPTSPITEENLCGRLIGGHWQVISVLGHGGMGVVYRARDEQSGSAAALKVLHPATLVGSPEDRAARIQRFRREAAYAAELTHPNTVRTYHAGIAEDGILYIAMELVDGESLDQLIKTEAPLPIPRAMHIARQVLGSLGEAHHKGLVHRDLKPANVLLTRHLGMRDFVRVLDFGISFRIGGGDERLTGDGHVIGSPWYMSPEQALDDHVDGAADLYSLGVVLFEMLTGQLPFVGAFSRPAEVLAAHRFQPPRPLQSVRRDAPPALAEFVSRMLAKSRSERFATAEAAIVALDAIGLEPDLAQTWHVDAREAPPAAAAPGHAAAFAAQGTMRAPLVEPVVLGAPRSVPSAFTAPIPKPAVRRRPWWPWAALGVAALAVAVMAWPRHATQPTGVPAAAEVPKTPAPSAQTRDAEPAERRELEPQPLEARPLEARPLEATAALPPPPAEAAVVQPPPKPVAVHHLPPPVVRHEPPPPPADPAPLLVR